jgi:hypothetical protein
MKKIIAVLTIVICASTFVLAQEFKPVAGDVSVEVNFTPLGNSPIGMNYLKGRYFLADDIAFRLGIDLGMKSNKSEPINTTNSNVTDEFSESYFRFGLFPGIEKHFGNYERFSPYIGAELGFVTKSAKTEYVDNENNTTYEIKGEWFDGSNRGFTSIGINVLAGADFYFTPRMYLGAEIGFGFKTISWGEVEETVGTTTEKTSIKESSTEIGFNYNPAIRLGFFF